MPSLEPLGREFVGLLPDRFVSMLETWRTVLTRVPEFLQGNGDPEGVVAAPRGTQYLRLDGSTGSRLYLKTTEAGSSGWEAI